MPKPNFALDNQTAITSELADKALYDETLKSENSQLAMFKGQLAIILEIADSEFKRKVPAEAIVSRLASHLHQLRVQSGSTIWKELIPIAQAHSVQEYLLQDPFTQWSFQKPLGYSGDATLLDIAYKHPNVDKIISSASSLGREIYAYTSDADSSVACRERLEILAKYVDEASAKHADAEILSVACGHMRESELAKALDTGGLKRWVALDQDPQSIAMVAQTCPADIVKPLQGSVSGLLRRSYKLGSFDLIYAAGLYDYLTKPLGVKLLKRCWEMVKPGGVLLFANFSDEIKTDGYMESFMDWPLILRNESGMRDIAIEAVGSDGGDVRVFFGANRYIIYAEITKNA